jgi:hypothetical protein
MMRRWGRTYVEQHRAVVDVLITHLNDDQQPPQHEPPLLREEVVLQHRLQRCAWSQIIHQ